MKKHIIQLLVLLISAPLWSSCDGTHEKSDIQTESDSATAVMEEKETPEQALDIDYDRITVYRQTKVTLDNSVYPGENVHFKRSVDLDWPEHLVGVESISSLQSRLMIDLFDRSYPDIRTALDDYMSGIGGYIGPYDPQDSICLRVEHLDDLNLIVCKIDKTSDRGNGNGLSYLTNAQTVVYDLRLGKVLEINDILKSPTGDSLLSLVNQEIDRINEAKDECYGHATMVPDDIIVSEKGLYFEASYREDVIVYVAHGPVLDIFIPYPLLEAELTDEFKKTIGL